MKTNLPSSSEVAKHLRAVQAIQVEVDLLVLATSSGSVRNELTETNIHLMIASANLAAALTQLAGSKAMKELLK